MRIIKPRLNLHPIVNAYYLMEKEDITSEKKYFAVSNPFIKISDNAALLSGSATYPITTSIPECDFGFAISLQLGSIHKLFKIPSGLITNQAINLEDIPGVQVKELIEKIQLSSTFQNKMDHLENFLIDIIKRNCNSDDIKPDFFELFINSTSYTISDIAGEAGISSRHLQRIVNNYIGMSPVLFRRILRFEKAINWMQDSAGKVSLTDIAYECGYSDQSHFIRDFKEFSGYTPSEHIKTAAMSDSYNSHSG